MDSGIIDSNDENGTLKICSYSLAVDYTHLHIHVDRNDLCHTFHGLDFIELWTTDPQR